MSRLAAVGTATSNQQLADQIAEDAALEQLGMAVGPGEHEGRDEMRAPVGDAAPIELLGDPGHGA